MEKRYVIRGIAADKKGKLCDRIVSHTTYESPAAARKALKQNDFDTCFNPYIAIKNA